MTLPKSASGDLTPTGAQHDGLLVSTPDLRLDKESLMGYNVLEFIRIFRIL
jgi:hypothetical protein